MPRVRRSDWIPKLCHHKPTGQAFVKIDGRVVYLGAHGSATADAAYLGLVGEWMMRRAGATASIAKPEGGPVPPVGSSITITELCVAFVRHAESYYQRDGQPTCAVAAVKAAIRRLRARFGNLPASTFGPRALKDLRASMIREGLSRKTINGYVSTVALAFRWGTSEELLPSGMYESLKSLAPLKRGRSEAKEGAPVPPVADAVIDATKRHLPRQLRDMVEVQRLTGMRPGELLQMTTGAIDTSGKVWLYRPAHHKTAHFGKDREVYLGPRAQEIVRAYLRVELDAPLFSPARTVEELRSAKRSARTTKRSASQTRRDSKRRALARFRRRDAKDYYTPSSYARAIARAVKVAFRPERMTDAEFSAWECPHHWHPHQLRHTAGTELRKAYGIEAARVVLGHADPGVTLIYAERDRGVGMKIAAEVG
ncbi:MAG: site-specific integrase [Phycisphaerales bacterium]|nr:site-specific integrase [Phycisphaerales bacterium]